MRFSKYGAEATPERILLTCPQRRQEVLQYPEFLLRPLLCRERAGGRQVRHIIPIWTEKELTRDVVGVNVEFPVFPALDWSAPYLRSFVVHRTFLQKN